jgi:protein-disulfide isomerase
MTELKVPVSARDHIRGPAAAPLVLVEYGDYECPDCKAAYPVLNGILAELGDEICFVYRHFPLVDIHERAMRAAEASEAAAECGAFWEMHDALYRNSPDLEEAELIRYAGQSGIGRQEFGRAFRSHNHRRRVEEDIESGLRSRVTGTPALFIKGMKHRGGFDRESLLAGLRVAR